MRKLETSKDLSLSFRDIPSQLLTLFGWESVRRISISTSTQFSVFLSLFPPEARTFNLCKQAEREKFSGGYFEILPSFCAAFKFYLPRKRRGGE